jgi:hypothetical protein
VDSQHAVTRLSYSFEVRAIAAEDVPEEERFLIGLSEHASGTGRYLIIDVAWAFAPQDRRGGIDTYCLYLDTGDYAYDALAACILEDQSLTLRLKLEPAARLGIDPECRLRLLVSDEQIDRLRAGLARIFAAAGTRPSQLSL